RRVHLPVICDLTLFRQCRDELRLTCAQTIVRPLLSILARHKNTSSLLVTRLMRTFDATVLATAIRLAKFRYLDRLPFTSWLEVLLLQLLSSFLCRSIA